MTAMQRGPIGSSAATPLVVFVSGAGRTLANLSERIQRGELPARITLVVASKPCKGEEWARSRGVPTCVLGKDIRAAELSELLAQAGVTPVRGGRPAEGWAVLAGFIRLLPIPTGYEHRFVNIHPALLPSFGGRGMYGERVHRAVLEAGCKVSGCTVHFTDGEYDSGPIVAQRACEVRDDDTPETLAARVFELEKELYPWALRALIEHRYSIQGRRVRIIPP